VLVVSTPPSARHHLIPSALGTMVAQNYYLFGRTLPVFLPPILSAHVETFPYQSGHTKYTHIFFKLENLNIINFPLQRGSQPLCFINPPQKSLLFFPELQPAAPTLIPPLTLMNMVPKALPKLRSCVPIYPKPQRNIPPCPPYIEYFGCSTHLMLPLTPVIRTLFAHSSFSPDVPTNFPSHNPLLTTSKKVYPNKPLFFGKGKSLFSQPSVLKTFLLGLLITLWQLIREFLPNHLV